MPKKTTAAPKSKPARKAKSAEAAPRSHSSATESELIRDLAGILHETELNEIEIEKSGLRIRVARQSNFHSIPFTMPQHVHGAHGSAPMAGSVPISHGATSADKAQHPGAVKSPMVGTAYCAAAPGAAPFVKIGDTVKEGQTLFIIEAMKTMNQIPSPRAGKVIEILVSDGQPVEFGEVLMVIE
jgi:acetyl-CoA carboxylase biotin carboxyl carrier protein